MKTTYLVTGATSGIGMILIRKLLDRGETVRALALPNDPLRDRIPEGAEVFSGNVTQRDSMEDFFQAGKMDMDVRYRPYDAKKEKMIRSQ